MNREIKFRAWNGIEMLHDVMVGKFGAFYINPGDNGKGLDPKDSASLTPFNTKLHEITPVMQYTGLNDKNGVDIYEGDIVRPFRHSGNMINILFVVNYDSDRVMFMLSDSIPLGSSLYGSFEIIGNIYEHPELLTKEKENAS